MSPKKFASIHRRPIDSDQYKHGYTLRLLLLSPEPLDEVPDVLDDVFPQSPQVTV